jgi:hypothetical protein
MTIRMAAIALVLALAPPAAGAAALDTAYDAYRIGNYGEAVALAKTGGSAEDFALAARAMNAQAYFDDGRKSARRNADDAGDLAEKAIELDPNLAEGYLQSAISLALKGARMSPIRAFLSGLAGKARDRIDAALELDPENPWALSTSGAWRIEVARRGGANLYGADPENGREELLRARLLAPGNLTIAYECALRMLADGRPEWRVEALASLDAALAVEPATKFERDIKARAHEFKAAIKAGPAAEKAFIKAQP